MLRLAKHLPFEVLKSNHHHSHIVEGLSVEGIFQNTLNCQPALLVHILCQFEILVIYGDTVPHAARDVLVRELVEDPITAQDDEVVVLGNFELVNIRLADHNIRVSAAKFKFCLWVTEGPRNGEPAGQNSNWANYVVSVVPIGMSSFLSSRGYHIFGSHARGGSCCLVDLATSTDDSMILVWVRRLVVLTERRYIFAAVHG